ncbi:DUF2589 domain-containing protein [Aureisphaera galaxeae]|uniref:DUF2589 domain-containing protein n=1 Tax=Aureisphaera galaxeae TaxID=1538023 RepID=UPI00234FCC0A|nr:DUF2589 domain-containing protein [Aureisphaera galaxeae]MDC8004704.1 DUF2589 domain-containing protein [Aureisphaera galaxeae]
MSQEQELVSMAQAFTGLPMEDLIGAPLNAAAKANAAMALTQTKFMLDTCFSISEDGQYTPIMIEMNLTRGVIIPATDTDPATIDTITTKFELPILTIIPLNSLAVDNVDITFEMEVKSSYGEETSEQQEVAMAAAAEWEVKASYGPVSASITGSASYDSKESSSFDSHYEKSNSAKYTVNVHAGQLPLPKGVNTIIEAYTLAIEPYEMPEYTNEAN